MKVIPYNSLMLSKGCFGLIFHPIGEKMGKIFSETLNPNLEFLTQLCLVIFSNIYLIMLYKYLIFNFLPNCGLGFIERIF